MMFKAVLGHVANIVTNVSAARKEFQGKWMIGNEFCTNQSMFHYIFS